MTHLANDRSVNLPPAVVTGIQLVGLAATGWVIWYGSLAPRLGRLPLSSVAGQAVSFALFAWAWSAAITLLLYLVAPGPARGDAFRMALRTSATAVWFAPAMTLLSEFSPAALIAALALVIGATRLLVAEWQRACGRDEVEPAIDPMPAGLFHLEPPGLLARQLAPALAVSLTLEAGALEILRAAPLMAAAWLAMSTAVATALAIRAGLVDAGDPPSLPRAILGALLTVILAAGLTVGGLAGHGRSILRFRWETGSGSRPGFLSSTRDLLRTLLYGDANDVPAPTATRLEPPPPDEDVGIAERGYTGVILWPEVETHTTLVAPLLARGHSVLGAGDRSLSIAFSGQYWMYKPPYSRPPVRSYFRRASPASLSFLSTDHRPLFMEAYHRLVQPIDLSCCGAIEVAISNADRFPGTVSLELVLIDSETPGRASLSLGREPVRSRPQLWGGSVSPVAETLDFHVPSGSPLGQFDVLKIVFHRDPIRMDRSAKIAIDRFVLVPPPR